MKKGSLRARLIHKLRQIELGIASPTRVGEGFADIPVRDLVQFLEATGDAQVEIAKRCLWKLVYGATIFPPAIALRRILSLQTLEKSLDSGAGHRPRDHLRHLVYLLALGIYLLAIDRNLQRNFNRQATSLKRGNHIGGIPTATLFVQAWIPFCIFHDAAYPVERLHSAAGEEVRKRIKSEYLDVYRDLRSAYVEEYAIRALANAASLIALLDFEDLTFKDLVSPHLTKDQEQALYGAVEKSGSSALSIKSLLASKPLVSIGPHFARLLAKLSGAHDLVAVVEAESTGEIVWLGNLERSIDIPCTEAGIDRSRAYRLCFFGLPETRRGYSVRYFIDASTVAVRVAKSLEINSAQYDDLLQVCAELKSNEDFRRCAKGGEDQIGQLAAIAYSELCSTAFLDNGPGKRFAREEAAVATRLVIEQHRDEIVKATVSSFGKAIAGRMKAGQFAPGDIVTNNEYDIAYSELAAEALELPGLVNAFKDEVRRATRKGAQPKLDVAALVSAAGKAARKQSENLAVMADALRAEVRPKIEVAVRRRRALSRLFENIGPRIGSMMEAANASKEMESVRGVNEVDVESHNFIRDLFASNEFLAGNALMDAADAQLLKEVGRAYAPAWNADHGMYAGALAMWAATLRWTLLKHQGFGQPTLAVLVLFHPSSRFSSAEVECAVLKATTAICARSISLHNFYPSLTEKHDKFRNRISSSAFTYFSLLADALQNWDRDVQYDAGKFDLSDIRPDGYYDIFFEDGRLQVVVNRRYANETTVLRLRRDLESYLQDVDTLVDIRLG